MNFIKPIAVTEHSWTGTGLKFREQSNTTQKVSWAGWLGFWYLQNWQPKFQKRQLILIFCVLLYAHRQLARQVPTSSAHILHNHPAHAQTQMMSGQESNSDYLGLSLVKCKKCTFIWEQKWILKVSGVSMCHGPASMLGFFTDWEGNRLIPFFLNSHCHWLGLWRFINSHTHTFYQLSPIAMILLTANLSMSYMHREHLYIYPSSIMFM